MKKKWVERTMDQNDLTFLSLSLKNKDLPNS